ncbi:N-6 DNA methylase [Aeoliella sp. ICT_H6.2]|uniref:N-6 DNA methylase n=1 Tax=Aeoliella straminimaris TaxID=2954799 RepID=A0A9X2JE65_9BACT|nr:N-6 DNA methylase [Aeoliella straminimaris]MCO6042670.1 N-6 DNA methylase [Aeoliella straminimaris]
MAKKKKAVRKKKGADAILTADPSVDDGDLPEGQAVDSVQLDEGQVVDLVTGEVVKLNDLELIIQEEQRKLLEEFGYPEEQKADLIRRKFRVRPKQLKAKAFPLVVLRSNGGDSDVDDQDRVYILMDIQKPKVKAEDSKKGAEGLAEFLRDTPGAEYAVWTNGTDRVVYWKETGRIKIRTRLINDIPRFGRGPEDCFAPGKQALRAASGLSLRQAFQRCHDYVYANRGGSNETIFWEFLKIVFAKIQDERCIQKAESEGAEYERRFRIASLEERNDAEKSQRVKDRVEELYAEVRQLYPELFAQQVEEVDLAPRILTYVVAQLADYDFLNSSVDVKGEAYEAIVGKNLQGTRGEFFTPRNAVKMGIRMLDPEPGMKCIDPACGTGGFIVVILNYMAAKIARRMESEGKDPKAKDLSEYNHELKLASQRIFGLDINPNLVRVARMNMVMNNDGQGGITHLGSLDRPESWEFPPGKTKTYQSDGKFKDVDIASYFRDELQEGTFDICASNPPFGTKIKIDSEAILSQYDLARRWSYDEERDLWSATPALQAGVSPEILFLERCVKLLKPGTGQLCIVLPDGLLGNPDDEYIRVWLMRHCEVLALVDMPVELFLPKVGMQTHLVFLRRKTTDEMNEESLGGELKDYPIFMAIAKNVGKDRRDNQIFKRDREGRILDHFRNANGQDLHGAYLKASVLDFLPFVDQYGRMVDDDLPFIAKAYHDFLSAKEEGTVDYER